MNEITNDLLYRALMRRAERERKLLRMACRRNDRLNARFQSLNDKLDREVWSPDGLGDLLYRCELQARRNERNLNGVRKTIRGIEIDLRIAERNGAGMGTEVRAESSSYKYGQWPHGYTDIHGPRSWAPCPFPESYS